MSPSRLLVDAGQRSDLVESRQLRAHPVLAGRPQCLALIVQSFNEGRMRVPDDRIIAKQNAAISIDTTSVVEGGKHPCLNKRT